MTRNRNYDDLMPGLFEELEKASKIVVLLRGGGNFNLFTQVPETELISVNGYETPQALGASLTRLGDKLIEQAMAIQSEFVPRERGAFLEQVTWHYKSVLEVVRPLPAGQLKELAGDTNLGSLLIFREVSIGTEGEMLVTGAFPGNLHIAVRKFAIAWLRSARETLEKLKMLSLMVAFFPGRRDLGLKQETEPKIIVRNNVEVIAVMARLLFECHVFAMPNKTEFCRLMCRCFATTHTMNMSFDHFKNCFDRPDPDTLRYVLNELAMVIEAGIRMEEKTNRQDSE
jgi:hypothetical protein